MTERTDGKTCVAHVLIRTEGQFYNAYLTGQEQIDSESLLLASVVSGITGNEELRQKFVALVSDVAKWAVSQATGEEATAELRKSEYGRNG